MGTFVGKFNHRITDMCVYVRALAIRTVCEIKSSIERMLIDLYQCKYVLPLRLHMQGKI